MNNFKTDYKISTLCNIQDENETDFNDLQLFLKNILSEQQLKGCKNTVKLSVNMGLTTLL
jgi:hypothetical protein